MVLVAVRIWEIFTEWPNSEYFSWVRGLRGLGGLRMKPERRRLRGERGKAKHLKNKGVGKLWATGG